MLTHGILVLIGLVIIAFSVKIAFPGLAHWLGNDAMFGKGNVVYNTDGSYSLSNPRSFDRMARGSNSFRSPPWATCHRGVTTQELKNSWDVLKSNF
jgi:hypothetical protein